MTPLDWVGRLRRRLRALVRRAAVEQEMDAEMRDHIERETAQLVAEGAAPAEARRRALVAFGGVARFQEEGRDARGTRVAEDAAADLQFAARILVRNPGFSLASIATFALGLGAASAIFSVVHGVLLAPLPYKDPSRLVAVWERRESTGATSIVSVTAFEQWQRALHVFDGIAALIPAPVTVTAGARAERVNGVQVSPGYFNLLGVTPLLGREFTPDESLHGGAPVVILSGTYWRQHFDGDSGVVGRSMTIDGAPVTIVGVMAPDFEPPRFGWIDEQALWLPFGPSRANRSWGHVLHVVARLRPGVTLDRANAGLAAAAAALANEDPSLRGWSIEAVGLARQMTGDVRKPLLLLMAGVGMLLLMAVTNVANLTLGLTRRREQEMAVRRAVGASTSRLVRQLLAQSAVLGTAGCAVGLAVAVAGVHLLTARLPAGMPRPGAIHLDGAVVVAALATTVLATFAFGLLAAFRGAGGGPASASLIGTLRVRDPGRVRGGSLVVGEIALALVLTVMAGLMLRSVVNLRAVDLGFQPAHVVAGRVALDGQRHASPAARRQFFDRLLESLRATPGIGSASQITVRPFRGGAPSTRVTNPERPPADPADRPIVDIRFADSSVFGTLGIPIIAGRPFAAHEDPDGRPHVLVNQALARALDLPANPVGASVDIVLNGGIHAEVIGVVGDVHLSGPRTPVRGTAWLAAQRYPDLVSDVLVRGEVPDELLMGALRRAVAAIDPGAPVYDVEPLQSLVDRAVSRDRFTAQLLGAFSLTALLLAAVGVHGVFAADVARRRGELGIRRALGAARWNIARLVLSRAIRRAAVGIGIGVVLSLALTRWMASLLFGLAATDPVAFIAVTALLFLTALTAALVPAIRAARVDPSRALRSG